MLEENNGGHGGSRTNGGSFESACLPFFTYGICHRDVVTIDDQHMVSIVVTKSGS
ncbi:DUF4265 domain-containing protein [Streptomyces peucetius]|uniref:DUF4265 domain-containing protein n=1 Tax=Streptomyces peucetius TaxID=1950 RepID=A0ABY6I7D3_STRPE|nr:DUF4265 domain-containing protein [Streptomyces peucetius]UYQ61882.1 DUF4265 domain-containing protein [Streptomyces peucetius]